MTDLGISIYIDAPRETIWRALTEPALIIAWREPNDMTATMHVFDLRVGGGYEMSLYYADGSGEQGKSGGVEDRYHSRFETLESPHRLVEAISFDSDDPAFAGLMHMTVTLEETGGGTCVTIACDGLPEGVRPEDNDEGTRASLVNLKRLAESGKI